MEKRLKHPLDYYYKMDHKNRGLCVIFNHETFHDTSLALRKGTKVDRDRLQKTFTALDFDVRIVDNPSEWEIRGILKKGELKMQEWEIFSFYPVNCKSSYSFLFIFLSSWCNGSLRQ